MSAGAGGAQNSVLPALACFFFFFFFFLLLSRPGHFLTNYEITFMGKKKDKGVRFYYNV